MKLYSKFKCTADGFIHFANQAIAARHRKSVHASTLDDAATRASHNYQRDLDSSLTGLKTRWMAESAIITSSTMQSSCCQAFPPDLVLGCTLFPLSTPTLILEGNDTSRLNSFSSPPSIQSAENGSRSDRSSSSMAGDELLKPTLHVEVLITGDTTPQASRQVRNSCLHLRRMIRRLIHISDT